MDLLKNPKYAASKITQDNLFTLFPQIYLFENTANTKGDIMPIFFYHVELMMIKKQKWGSGLQDVLLERQE